MPSLTWEQDDSRGLITATLTFRESLQAELTQHPLCLSDLISSVAAAIVALQITVLQLLA